MTGARRIVLLLLGMVLTTSLAYAELETKLVKSQALGATPVAIVQSAGDGRLFVLLEGGVIQILSANGQQEERFNAGDGVTSMAVSPDGQRLYLGNAKSKELQFLDLINSYELPVNNSAVKGVQDAPVTITLFDDFQCPYCARLVPTLEQVIAAYPKQVRVVFKQFPLNMHPFAKQAAISSLAARNQGKFWPLHDQLFANYNKLSEAKIRELAKSVGLDMARFDKDVANPALQQEVAEDIQLGVKAGVRGTPAAFINGKPLKDRSFSGFKSMIDAALRETAQ